MDISFAQYQATIKVFQIKKIPFRSFLVEKEVRKFWVIIPFFMLETILLGKMMKINPYDQLLLN